MFGLLAVAEYLTHGVNLPPRPVQIAENLFVTGWSVQELYGVYLYHVLLLCTLLCVALIEIDGQRPPWKLFLPALVVGVAMPLVWPQVHPVPALAAEPAWASGTIDGLAGLAVGAALGWLAWWALREKKHVGLMLGMPLVGLFLGWQAILVVAFATMAIHLPLRTLGRILPKLRIPPSVWLGGLTLAWIIAWATLVSYAKPG